MRNSEWFDEVGLGRKDSSRMRGGEIMKRSVNVYFLIAGLLVVMGLITAPQAWAKTYFSTNPKLALKGYDPVAYFTLGNPRMGSNEFEHDWKGSKWQFVSAENRKLFKRNPEKYAPRYGGYCAWAAAQGYTAEGDPEVWRIVDGKLYLNFNRAVQEKWFKDIPGFIKKADKNWPGILEK
jgi:YHS domain-containing protein